MENAKQCQCRMCRRRSWTRSGHDNETDEILMAMVNMSDALSKAIAQLCSIKSVQLLSRFPGDGGMIVGDCIDHAAAFGIDYESWMAQELGVAGDVCRSNVNPMCLAAWDDAHAAKLLEGADVLSMSAQYVVELQAIQWLVKFMEDANDSIAARLVVAIEEVKSRVAQYEKFADERIGLRREKIHREDQKTLSA